jgi:hypothetical protein
VQVAAEPDEAAGELEEAEVVLGLLLVADEEAAALGEPGQRPLDHPPPSLVPLGSRRALVADGGDVWDVVPVDAGVPADGVVVALVGAEVLGEVGLGCGALQDDGVDGRGEELRIRDVRPDHGDGQRAAVGLDQEALLHAGLGPISGVGAHEVPPKRAFRSAPSAACHSQSQPPRSSHASCTTAQIRSKTPRSIQRWSVRWTELSSGYSFGSRFHWQPLRTRKMIASNAPRWSIRFGPRFGGSCSDRIGSTTSYSSSRVRQIGGSGARAFFGLSIMRPPIQDDARLMPV